MRWKVKKLLLVSVYKHLDLPTRSERMEPHFHYPAACPLVVRVKDCGRGQRLLDWQLGQQGEDLETETHPGDRVGGHHGLWPRQRNDAVQDVRTWGRNPVACRPFWQHQTTALGDCQARRKVS